LVDNDYVIIIMMCNSAAHGQQHVTVNGNNARKDARTFGGRNWNQ